MTFSCSGGEGKLLVHNDFISVWSSHKSVVWPEKTILSEIFICGWTIPLNRLGKWTESQLAELIEDEVNSVCCSFSWGEVSLHLLERHNRRNVTTYTFTTRRLSLREHNRRYHLFHQLIFKVLPQSVFAFIYNINFTDVFNHSISILFEDLHYQVFNWVYWYSCLKKVLIKAFDFLKFSCMMSNI